jgi:hypothetical protein
MLVCVGVVFAQDLLYYVVPSLPLIFISSNCKREREREFIINPHEKVSIDDFRIQTIGFEKQTGPKVLEIL